MMDQARPASLFQAMQQKSREHIHFQTLIPFSPPYQRAEMAGEAAHFLPPFSSRLFSGFV
jgi:hypothetical protein